MKRFLNKYKCGLCNSNKTDYIYTHENLKYRQCKNCDLVFQERINDPNLKEKLKIEYNETYYKKITKLHQMINIKEKFNIY